MKGAQASERGFLSQSRKQQYVANSMISMICSSNLFWIRFKRFSISCTVNDNFNNTPFIIITILFYIDRAPRDICILRSQVVYRCIQLVFPVHNTLCKASIMQSRLYDFAKRTFCTCSISDTALNKNWITLRIHNKLW